MASGARRCAITGVNGFVGGRIADRLTTSGWQVVPWTREPRPGSDSVAFRLGDAVDPERLRDVDALVHCAYDFRPRGWEEIARVNIGGSAKLFDAARQAGVERIVFISSLSAFAGCRSLYGKAKLETESLARAAGATVLRPGLVYGDRPGSLFGRLVRQVRATRLVPVPAGPGHWQYPLHEQDLAALVEGLVEGRFGAPGEPIPVAHEQPWSLRDIVSAIAQTLGRPITLVPVPWQLMWLGLKSLELAGLPVGFRSDSLVGLVHQDPNPSFAWLAAHAFHCRPFGLTEAMVTP